MCSRVLGVSLKVLSSLTMSYATAVHEFSRRVHSAVDGHLGWFCLLVIVTNAALTILIRVFWGEYACISFGYKSKSGIAGP